MESSTPGKATPGTPGKTGIVASALPGMCQGHQTKHLKVGEAPWNGSSAHPGQWDTLEGWESGKTPSQPCWCCPSRKHLPREAEHPIFPPSHGKESVAINQGNSLDGSGIKNPNKLNGKWFPASGAPMTPGSGLGSRWRRKGSTSWGALSRSRAPQTPSMPKIPGMVDIPCASIRSYWDFHLPSLFLGLPWTFPRGCQEFWGPQLPHSSILGCCSRLPFHEGSKSHPQTWCSPRVLTCKW